MRSIVIVAVGGLIASQTWAQVALTPDTPAITPSPVFVPGGPAITAPANPNIATTNATLVALSDSLATLQTNLQQTLPILILFNNNFDFVSLGDNGLAASSSANPPGNFSANLGSNFARNMAVNTAVPTGPPLANNLASRTTPAAAAGLPQGFATIPVTSETLRALIVLQSELQRIMPLVNALNNGTTNAPGNFTNLFGLIPTSQ